MTDHDAAALEDDEDILLNTESYVTGFSNLDLTEKSKETQLEPESVPLSARENETRTQPDEVPPPALSTAFNMTPEQLDELLQKFKAFYHLTRRETEILRELLWERSIQEIAETLVITPRTVKYHISNLFQKTGATTQKTLKRILRKQKRRFDCFVRESCHFADALNLGNRKRIHLSYRFFLRATVNCATMKLRKDCASPKARRKFVQ